VCGVWRFPNSLNASLAVHRSEVCINGSGLNFPGTKEPHKVEVLGRTYFGITGKSREKWGWGWGVEKHSCRKKGVKTQNNGLYCYTESQRR
jgi:hypothetical protein